jgi:hypothetical protein
MTGFSCFWKIAKSRENRPLKQATRVLFTAILTGVYNQIVKTGAALPALTATGQREIDGTAPKIPWPIEVRQWMKLATYLTFACHPWNSDDLPSGIMKRICSNNPNP